MNRQKPKSCANVRRIPASSSKKEFLRERELIMRASISGYVETATTAAEVASNLCKEANGISAVIGASGETERIAREIFSEAEAVLNAAEEVARISDMMAEGKISVDDAYRSSGVARDEAIKHRNAAHEAFEELEALQRRLLAENKAKTIIGNLISMGVSEQIARELCRADWNLAGLAVEVARKIAIAKDEKNLSYTDVAMAIRCTFDEGGWKLEDIFSERRHIYEGGIPNSTLAIRDIEKKLGASIFYDAVFHGISGVGAVYRLRCMKLLAMVDWIFYQSEYLWRFESFVKASGVDSAEVKAEA